MLSDNKPYSKLKDQIHHFAEHIKVHGVAYMKTVLHKTLVELESIYY